MKRLPALLVLAIAAIAFAAMAKSLPLPQVPAELRTPHERAAYVAAHFWDGFDSADADMLNADTMAQNVANYLSVIPVIADDSVRTAAVAEAVRKMNSTEDAALLFSQTIETYLFGHSSPMRDEQLFRTFLAAMVAAQYPDAPRSAWLLEMTGKNQPGDKAADFEFIDRAGVHHTLYSELGQPTILFFYDPDCEDCHAAARQMAADVFLSTKVEQGRAKVVAIHPGELDVWKENVQKFPREWVDGCDEGAIDADGIFMIKGFPTLYLLAADGTVILKDAPVSAILSAIP